MFLISGLKFQCFSVLGAFAFLWFVLINHLRVEWTLNPQYGYGWAVPFLCAYLIWKNAEKLKTEKLKGKGEKKNFNDSVFPAAKSFSVSAFQRFSFLLLALLYAPTRLIEEANPDWRLVSWALAIEVVGITLISFDFLIFNFQFNSKLKTQNSKLFNLPSSVFIFPLCFFLVAVPWPTLIEQPLIQGLTRTDASTTCELLGWFGIPAMPHGNVIEVATGEVGIDEACSGIRSFQATLMISLFLGESYRLSVFRRSILCLGGFAMSFVFNLARMSVLVWVAASKGVGAIAKWHDPAGVTILVACFCGLWGLGVLLKKAEMRKAETLKAESGKRKVENGGQTAEGGGRRTERIAPRAPDFRISVFSVSAFILWLFFTEVSVAAWYHWHEVRLPQAAQWTIAFPANAPAFAELPLPERTRQILRYDEGRSAGWNEGALQWQAIFLRWNPGKTALHLAQNHTPEVCLTAAGHQLTSVSDLQWLDVRGLRMPFRIYEVTDTPRPIFVFYCLWDDRASTQGFATMGLTYGNRLAPVLAGLRNPGQRSIEIAVSGAGDAAAAETAVRDELGKIVTVTK